MLHFSRLITPCIFVCFLVGCSNQDEYPVHSVTGKVLYKGEPATGAEVTFHGETDFLKGQGSPIPRGVVTTDGTFQLSSFLPNDGAPIGRYRVSIRWPEELRPDSDPEDSSAQRDRLSERYSDPNKSGIAVEVNAGNNQIPIFDIQ